MAWQNWLPDRNGVQIKLGHYPLSTVDAAGSLKHDAVFEATASLADSSAVWVISGQTTAD